MKTHVIPIAAGHACIDAIPSVPLPQVAGIHAIGAAHAVLGRIAEPAQPARRDRLTDPR